MINLSEETYTATASAYLNPFDCIIIDYQFETDTCFSDLGIDPYLSENIVYPCHAYNVVEARLFQQAGGKERVKEQLKYDEPVELGTITYAEDTILTIETSLENLADELETQKGMP